MRRIVVPWCLTLLLLLLAIPAPQAHAVPRQVGEVVRTHSSAEHRLNRMEPWEPLAADTKLAAGCFVRTHDHAVRVALQDGATLDVSPDSLITFRDATQVNLRPGVSELAHRVDLEKGKIRITLPKGKQRLMFVVHTNEILGVFGHGTSRASVVPQGMLAVVEAGAARVASQGRWVDVPSGHYAVLGPSAAAGSIVHTLAPAPSPSTEPCEAGEKICTIGLVQGAGKTLLALRWRRVAKAGAYHVRLASDANMSHEIAQAELPASRTEWVTEPLPAGKYYATVQSMGADGVRGGTSAPRALRVVQLLLDQGADFLRQGNVVVLPPGARVRLREIAGLARKRGRVVPSSLQLSGRQKSRVLSLFVPGHPQDTATVVVERRQLRAQVSLTPADARWPGDEVVLRVTLHDPSSRLSVSDVYPRIRARLNRTPLMLPIRRKGDVWTARIPPRNGRGPWVIRVDVTDLHGYPLGHGFLEVLGKGSKGR